jgi:hypothetical protein
MLAILLELRLCGAEMVACCCLNSERHEALWVVLTVDGVAVVATGVVVGTLPDHVAQLSTGVAALFRTQQGAGESTFCMV